MGPSPRALEAYEEAKAQLARYPDGSAPELRNAIAEVHELDAQRIICGAGSDEILGLICRAYAGPGDEVITSGGIIGIVDRVMEDDRIEVTIGENTKVQIIRSTITSLLKKEEVKK